MSALAALDRLSPFVVLLVRSRVAAGAEVTPALVEECFRQAVADDTERCLRVLRMKPDARSALVEALAAGVYDAIPPDANPRYTTRWEALARHLGRQPTSQEFLTSQPLVSRLMATAEHLPETLP